MLVDCLTKNQPLYWVCLISQQEQNKFLEEGMGVRDRKRAAGIWVGKALIQQLRGEEEGEHVTSGTSLRVSPGKTLLLGVGGLVWGDGLS